MALMRRLAVLATAAEAARRYARNNPDKAAKYLDQAAAFVDKQTKGKYSGQIRGVADKAKNVAGIRSMPGQGATGNGYTQGYERNAGFGKTAGYSAPPPPTTSPATPPPPAPQPGQANPER
jgi:alkylation response protein AidB-like acyl-CoA dehydrogenase